jgi:Polyketide cyclase / dehydrase and lipid transport
VVTETTIDVPPEDAWDALRDFGALHERLVPGFVVDARLERDRTRVVTFFNGAVARETLVGVDEERRRLAYAVVESALGLTHHNASTEVRADEHGGTRFVWITDVLPDDAAPRVQQMMEHGIGVIKQTLESARV